MLCKKGVLRNFTKFTGEKHLWRVSFYSIRPATLLKQSLWHRCFPVNFAKTFLRTPFYRTPPVAASVKFWNYIKIRLCWWCFFVNFLKVSEHFFDVLRVWQLAYILHVYICLILMAYTWFWTCIHLDVCSFFPKSLIFQNLSGFYDFILFTVYCYIFDL